jgi:hypothetical protein
MRTTFLIPLAFAAAAMTGCGTEVSRVSEQEERASRAAMKRDLTLQVPQGPAAEVVSAVELSRPNSEPARSRIHRPSPKPKPGPRPASEPGLDAAAQPPAQPVIAPTVAVTEVLAEPAPEDDAAADGRELAPGKTVTLVPVSSGPSAEPDYVDSWFPSERPQGIFVGDPDHCRPRGGAGGIGIAGRFPVGLPAHRLR